MSEDDRRRRGAKELPEGGKKVRGRKRHLLSQETPALVDTEGLYSPANNVARERERHYLRSRWSIGGAVAKEFAREGASVFLTGPNRMDLETVAKGLYAKVV